MNVRLDDQLIGEEVYIYFHVENDGDDLPSAMYIDDISLQVCFGSP